MKPNIKLSFFSTEWGPSLRIGRGVGSLGPEPHLLVLERVPPLPAVLHLEQGQGQLAQELESGIFHTQFDPRYSDNGHSDNPFTLIVFWSKNGFNCTG